MIATADLTRSLVEHLARPRRKTQPVVCAEIALAGSWGSHGRLDVAALHWGSNWSWMLDGYEVKVSRQDFTRDIDAGKHQKYLPSLDRLFFAAPKGLIRKEELPPGIGLIVWSEDGDSWSVVKRADRNHDRQDTGQLARILRRTSDEHAATRRQLDELQLAAKLQRIFANGRELQKMSDLGCYWLSQAARDRLRRTSALEAQAERKLRDAQWEADRLVEGARRRAAAADRLGPAVRLLTEAAALVGDELRYPEATRHHGKIERALEAIKTAERQGAA
jgi:hypothetical protein